LNISNREWTSSVNLSSSFAVYTTIYPAVRGYLVDWYRSLCQQTEQDFQLWIGLDSLDRCTVENIFGHQVDAYWLEAPRGSSPAQIREMGLSRIAETCKGVVLVDSDDLLEPSRVAAARNQLEICDIGGCALRLVDAEGNDLGSIFDLPSQRTPEEVFPRCNVFGFSNSVLSAELLQRCLPIPKDAILVDWFLATRAWLLGSKMGFDRVPRMKYRQHAGTMAHVRLPFCKERVASHTEMVRHHFKLVLAAPPEDFVEARYESLVRVQADVEEFWRRIVLDSERLQKYIDALNALAPTPVWWTSVAYPSLQSMWR
jgi:hypothetical protein